ncbi:hypothetical protein [Agromyces sp. Soil535]|uniref:hypothetical protein n=1 Tax=Agromyces sp. Soil535 TaxID=1736390 RepID=UPI0006FB421D|nr:hypothetical protein [Agromyces sp. Soil535]KRE22328.1 hypothetical protein ASG80_10335 [Agromyces sp. Soil535]
MGTEHEDPLERRRDELRRVVYGTPGGAGAVAEAELAAVEEELAARVRGALPVASESSLGDGESGRGTTEPPVPAPTPEEPRARWRPTRAWVIGAVVAVLLLLAGGISVIGPVREALSPPRGLAVFDREPLPDDLERIDQVATGAGLQPDDAATLRSIGRAFGYDFWVFRDDNRVCLLSRRQFFFDWVRSCATIQEFEAHGLTRRIAADDIRDGAKPRRIGPGDVVVVSWGPESTEVDWTVEP